MFYIKRILRMIYSQFDALLSLRCLPFTKELRQKVSGIEYGPSPSSQAEEEWLENRKTIKRQILNSNPSRFLRWPVIQKTMFVGENPFISNELNWLKSLRNWENKWKNAIRENSPGQPVRLSYYPGSSANLVHHAYTLAFFEEVSGLAIQDLTDVFEFGGGYGSMARLFYSLGYRGKYTIFDLPEFSSLQSFYLRSLGLEVYAPTSKNGNIRLISDFDEFTNLAGEKTRNSLFLATWSLSETSSDFREKIVNAVFPRENYLIALQDQFNEVNNLNYFNALSKRFSENTKWTLRAIDHLPGNSYLFGGKK